MTPAIRHVYIIHSTRQTLYVICEDVTPLASDEKKKDEKVPTDGEVPRMRERNEAIQYLWKALCRDKKLFLISSSVGRPCYPWEKSKGVIK